MAFFILILNLVILGMWSYLFIDEWTMSGSISEAFKEAGIGYTLIVIFMVIFGIMNFTLSFQNTDYDIYSISTHEDNNGIYVLGCGGETTDTEYRIHIKDKKGLKCKYVDANDCTIYITKGKEHFEQNDYSTKLYLHQDTIDKLTK